MSQLWDDNPQETHPEGPHDTSVDRPLCRHLRTKAFHLDGRFDPDLQESGSSSQYWCLHTMYAFGPDGEFVCPEECDKDRSCFQED